MAMTRPRQIVEGFSRWIDSVTATVVGIFDRLAAPRTIRLVEEEGGAFVLQSGDGGSFDRLQIVDGAVVGTLPENVTAKLRGSRIELVLRSARFLFRPLELPQRASEFLEGVVRAQIDRLTPWGANDAVFGWSKPVVAGTDRILVTVAATARALVIPYVQALADVGAGSVSVSALSQDAASGPVPIKVLQQKGRGALDLGRVRRVLVIVLAGAALMAAAATAGAVVIGSNLQARQDELAQRIVARRTAMRVGRETSLDSATTAERMLERRKHETASSVLVLETLSQVLPDHTYVTELRIEGDKLRLIGFTRDAPSLIGLIEQSTRFTRATFFAPTTRSPSDPGERFHIEARIQPWVLSRS
jgi:general secretion pathway protein L